MPFSAHVDYPQNSEFINIERVGAEHSVRTKESCICLFREKNAMGRLRAAMEGRYRDRGIDRKLYTPANLETMEISIRQERIAKVRFVVLFEMTCKVCG